MKSISEMNFGSKLFFMLSLCFFIVLSGVANAKTFRLGYNHTDDHPTGEAMIYFAKLIEEYSGKKHRVRLYPNGQLGDERKMLEQVQNGLLDITKTATVLPTTYENGYSALVLPYMFRDADHFVKVTNGDIGEDLMMRLERRGFIGLNFLYDEPRSFYTRNKAIVTPPDLSGLKIRVMNSSDAISVVNAIGAAPSPISWSEVYPALQQGVVDGAVGGPSALTLYNHGDVAKFFTNDQHVIYPGLIVISTKVWKQLSDEDKAMFKKAAREASDFQREKFIALEQQAMKDMVEMGVTITEPDVEAFKKLVQPIYVKAREDKDMSELIDKIEAVK